MRYRIMARKTGPGKVRIRLQQGDKHWTETIDDMVEQQVLEETWDTEAS